MSAARARRSASRERRSHSATRRLVAPPRRFARLLAGDEVRRSAGVATGGIEAEDAVREAKLALDDHVHHVVRQHRIVPGRAQLHGRQPRAVDRDHVPTLARPPEFDAHGPDSG
jgi:hypothetical protein